MRDAEKSKFTAGVVLVRTFLCAVYSEIGDHDAAVSVIDERNYVNMDNLAVTLAFSFGASLYAYARAEDIENAEKSLANFGDGFEGAYFLANYYFILGKCYLALKKKEFPRVIKISSETLSQLNESGVNFLNAELLLIMGVAYKEQGLLKEAKTKLMEGILEAERLGSRKNLWLLQYNLGLLHQLEGDMDEAERCFKEAIKLVQYIADHIEDPHHKEKFLSKVEVEALHKFFHQAEMNS